MIDWNFQNVYYVAAIISGIVVIITYFVIKKIK